MIPKHNPIHCIVPPHILHALVESEDEKLRQIGLRALLATERLRGQRTILRQMNLVGSVSTGEKRRTIYDAQHSTFTFFPGKLVRGEGDPPVGDPAVNEAYDSLGATYDFYRDVLKRNSIDNRGMRLDASVHFGDDYDNAFWDGRQMFFGDGDNLIFVGFTKAIDVIGHELTHGVTQHTSNLDYHNQPGALNESFSDVFGSLVKQYYLKQDVKAADWLIGAGILAPGVNGVALRSMKEPGTAYDDKKLGGKDPQPGHMEDYVELPDTEEGDHGGVHINSGIPNRALFALADQLGGYAWEDAGHIWYQTLLQLWHDAQFQDCANVSFQVAGTQYGPNSTQQQAVRTAWDDVGITISTGAALRRPQRPRSRAAAAADGNGALKKQLGDLIAQLQKVVNSLP